MESGEGHKTSNVHELALDQQYTYFDAQTTLDHDGAAPVISCPAESGYTGRSGSVRLRGWNRQSYSGSLLRNGAANILPAVYVILSRIWLADLDTAYVALASAYFYIGGAAEVINEGIPKAGWRLIADRNSFNLQQRYQLACTLILTVSVLGLALTVCIVSATHSFVDGYIPENIRSRSFVYIRLSSGSVFCEVFINVLSVCTRALDEPDVPLFIQSIAFVIAIMLDLLLISRFRVLHRTPNVNLQAINKLVCDVCAALAGLAYFLRLACKRMNMQTTADAASISPSWQAFGRLLRFGWPFVIEVIPRSIFNLWWSAWNVNLGPTYAAAWGVFLTIRAGILFAPLLAIEASCYTFVGHAWGQITALRTRQSKLTREDFSAIARIILLSSSLVVAVETVMYVVFAFQPGWSLAYFFSADRDVADLVVLFWRRLDWGFVLITIYFQTTSLLIIAAPRWYMAQSLVVILCFALPILLVAKFKALRSGEPWEYLLLATAATYATSLVGATLCTALWVRRQVRSDTHGV